MLRQYRSTFELLPLEPYRVNNALADGCREPICNASRMVQYRLTQDKVLNRAKLIHCIVSKTYSKKSVNFNASVNELLCRVLAIEAMNVHVW